MKALPHLPKKKSKNRRDSPVFMAIHSTAIISPKAEIHPQAEIGPYVVIERHVKVGRGTTIMAHAYLTGWTEIGEENAIHMGAIIGHEPQDVAYGGQETYLKIGHRNVIREHAQIHRGTKPGSATVIGDDNYLMHHGEIRQALALLFRRRVNLAEAVRQVEAGKTSEDVAYLLHFIKNSSRGVCAGPRKGG